MKLRILFGSLAWILVVTLLHVWSNIGFGQFATDVKVALGTERATMRVAFLPVT